MKPPRALRAGRSCDRLRREGFSILISADYDSRLALRHRLDLGSEATSADIDFPWRAVNIYSGAVNVGEPPGARVALGVADVVAGLSGLAAYFASSHGVPLTEKWALSKIGSRRLRSWVCLART